MSAGRTATVLRRTQLARVSPKRRDMQSLYERAVQTVLLRDKGCVVARVWPEVRCSGRLDPHHVWTQRMYPERRCDPEAMVTSCRAHHDAVHAYPVLARQRGVLK